MPGSERRLHTSSAGGKNHSYGKKAPDGASGGVHFSRRLPSIHRPQSGEKKKKKPRTLLIFIKPRFDALYKAI